MNCKNPLLSPYLSNVDLITEHVRKNRERLMYLCPELNRRDSIDLLEMMIRFDNKINPEDKTILQYTIDVLREAGAA